MISDYRIESEILLCKLGLQSQGIIGVKSATTSYFTENSREISRFIQEGGGDHQLYCELYNNISYHVPKQPGELSDPTFSCQNDL